MMGYGILPDQEQLFLADEYINHGPQGQEIPKEDRGKESNRDILRSLINKKNNSYTAFVSWPGKS